MLILDNKFTHKQTSPAEQEEVIDGELFWMDTPTWTHQSILTKLVVEISLYIRNKKGKCEVLPAPFGVYIKKENCNCVEPDILVISDMKKRSDISFQI